jgi:hypothetical protein
LKDGPASGSGILGVVATLRALSLPVNIVASVYMGVEEACVHFNSCRTI